MARLAETVGIGSGERGFTLIELLVIMAAGMVVSVVLFAVLDFTTRQTSRVLSRIDATQRARSTLQTIEGQLQAGCVSSYVAPIRPESTGSSLSFVSGFGSDPNPTPVKHTINFTPSGNYGTLTDSIYQPTGTGPSTGFNSLPSSTTTLLDRVAQSGGTPVFQYFGFEHPNNGSIDYTDAANNGLWMLLDDPQTELPPGAKLGGTPVPPNTSPANTPRPLPAAPLGGNSSSAVEVKITFVAYPQESSDLDPNLVANSTFSDAVVLRLTPVANHAGASTNLQPCA
jgi:type II secretory pathway pseudopilin PulG